MKITDVGIEKFILILFNRVKYFQILFIHEKNNLFHLKSKRNGINIYITGMHQ
jgi:hypothetical protein